MLDQRVLVNETVDIAAGDVRADLDVQWIEIPRDCARQCGNVDPLGYVN